MSTPYRVPILEQFEWQQKVKNFSTSTPPGSPAKGDRYVVKATGTGAWAGKDNQIAWYDGAAWKFDAPVEGWVAYDDSAPGTADGFMFYTGSVWAKLSHTQNTDQFLDQGGANEISAVHAKAAYDQRGEFDSALKAIVFNLP